MTALIEFMNAPVGRAARILLGVGLIYLGFAMIEGITGSLVAGAGVVPIAMGLAGRCLI